MVKVIGKDEKHVHKISCNKCASILEYVKKEIQNYVATDYGGGRDTYYYIECPECSNKVHVKNY